MRRHGVLTVGALAVVLIGVSSQSASLAQGAGTTDPKPGVRVAAAADDPRAPLDAEELAGAIEDGRLVDLAGDLQGPNAGSSYFDDDGVLHVGVTPEMSAASRTAVSTVAVAEPNMVTEVSRFSQSDLAAARDEVLEARPNWEKLGIDIGMVGERPRDNKIAVQVLGGADQAKKAVAQLAHSEAVLLDFTDLGTPQAIPQGYGRDNDTKPFHAGNFARVNNEGACTTGPGVKSDGVEYVVTAAHCFTTGSWAYIDNPFDRSPRGEGIGQVTRRSTAEGGIDVELIPSDVTRSMQMSPTYDYAVVMRTTPGSTVAGREVCFNGAFTGPRCSATINGDYVNYCDEYNFGGDLGIREVCHLVSTYRGEGVAAGQGDSGGPVYALAGSGEREYMGTITGPRQGAAEQICDQWSNGGTRECSKAITYTNMYHTLSFFNVTLKN